jgi:hypothetical protein
MSCLVDSLFPEFFQALVTLPVIVVEATAVADFVAPD